MCCAPVLGFTVDPSVARIFAFRTQCLVLQPMPKGTKWAYAIPGSSDLLLMTITCVFLHYLTSASRYHFLYSQNSDIAAILYKYYGLNTNERAIG